MKKRALSLLLAWTLMLGMIPINATAAEPYTDVPVVSELVPEPLPEKPEAIKSEEPESTEPEVPEASEPEEPESTEPEVPEASEPEAPESTEPQVPEVVEPEVPETTEPEVPEIIEPEIPVITPPVIELPMLELEPAIEVPEVLADGSEITSQEQLQRMGEENSYTLANDIELSDWESIDFAGTLGGNGHTITLAGQPLFNELSGNVQNLCLTGEVTDEDGIVGALARTQTAGTVNNCWSGAEYDWYAELFAGFVGTMSGGTIKN